MRGWRDEQGKAVFRAAMRFDDTLIALYEEVAGKAVDQTTRTLFADLLHLEQQEKIQVARAAMSLDDL